MMTWEEIGMTPEQFVATFRESPQGPQYEAGLVCLYHHIRQADPLLLARAAEWRSIMQGGMPQDYCTVHHPTNRLLRDEPTTPQTRDHYPS